MGSRSRCIPARSGKGGDLEDADLTVDATAVRHAADEAVSCLKQAQGIRAALTGIKTSSDKARASLDEMVANVEERLMRVESLVEAADPEACGPAGAYGSSSSSLALSRSAVTSNSNGAAEVPSAAAS